MKGALQADLFGSESNRKHTTPLTSSKIQLSNNNNISSEQRREPLLRGMDVEENSSVHIPDQSSMQENDEEEYFTFKSNAV